MAAKKPDKELAPVRPEPTEAQRAQIALATERRRGRKLSVSVNYAADEEDNHLRVISPHSDEQGWINQLDDAFGTRSTALAQVGLSQLANLLGSSFEEIGQGELNAVLAAVDGLNPQNEAEGMLAVEMVGTHFVALEMLRRARRAADRGAMNDYGTLATKLLRTYTTQLEALAKLRRGGEQKVRVEHVHVYPGGQAIVGNIESNGTGGGASNGSDQQCHDPSGIAALAYAPGAPMWSPESCREPCQAPAVKSKRRCRLHGGTNPGAPQGPANGMWRHGLRSRKHIEMKRAVRAFMRHAAQTMESL